MHEEPALPSRHEPPPAIRRRRSNTIVAAVLFFCTFVSTTTLGVVVYLGSRTDVTTDLVPFLGPQTLQRVWNDPELLSTGLLFSVPLLLILLAHEMGHYLACRYYRIDSSPPYFLPSPLFIGTFGAFIRIRGRIPGRRELFDVGIAGPIAGFLALVPFLVLGIGWSSPGVAIPADESTAIAQLYQPGRNLAFAGLEWLFFGPLPSPLVLNLHPFALAAWVGLLLTALNLLPLGQLDGGHVLYALLGPAQRRYSWLLWFVLAGFGLVWRGWLIWCLLLLILGLRHPPVARESEPLGPTRRKVAWVALGLFLVSFTPVPLSVMLVRADSGTVAFSRPTRHVGSSQSTSTTKVTGPSLTSETDIEAPKRPVLTFSPRERSSSTSASIIRRARSGSAARSKDGRRPLSRDAASVN